MVFGEKLYTVEEFWEVAALPENEDKRLELEDGVIVEIAASRVINSVVGARIGSFLNNFVIPHASGYVTSANGAFKLAPRTIRLPNTAYISKSRVANLDGKEFDVAPDLAVEVVSEDEDIFKKAREYLHAGTRLVWAVYPDEKIVYVFTLNDDGGVHAQPYDINATLTGGDVLPGFTLKVRDIFP